MINMNKKMDAEYRRLSESGIDLHGALGEIVHGGFCSEDGCFFLKKCFEVDTNVSRKDFFDKTGYECFINSINIDDYVDSNYLEYGVLFVRNVFSLWNSFEKNKKFISIVSLSDFGLKVKFHLARPDERWLDENLEGYENSILVVDSSEENF